MLNLKAGDKVLMQNTWNTEIKVVDKITPTGLIKVGGYTFRPDGRERGGDSYHPQHIEPLTPELEVKFYKKQFISNVANRARDYDFRNMSYDIAKALNKLLGLQIKDESMNEPNVPNNLGECETIEEVVAFYMAKGYDVDEIHEIIKIMSHDPMSNDIFKR